VKTYFDPALVRQKSRAKPDDFCLMAKPKHVKKIIQKARETGLFVLHSLHQKIIIKEE